MKTESQNEEIVSENVSNKPKEGNRKERRAKAAQNRPIEKKFNKEFANNNEWTRLKTEVYSNTKSLFLPVATLVNTLNNRKETLYKYMTKDELEVFSRLCSILSRDIASFEKELNMIYNIHSNRDGSCSMDDWSIMMELTEKYFIFTTSFNSVVSPIYDHIVDLLHIFEHRQLIDEQSKNEDNGIEDGNFKEIEETV